MVAPWPGTGPAGTDEPRCPWQRPAEPRQVRDARRLSADLAHGALGIGVLPGYAPAVSPDEYLAVATLAARAGVPTFTHARDLMELVPETLIDGAGFAARTRPADQQMSLTEQR